MDAATFSQRFKALREKRGMSQEQLSAEMGIRDRQTISTIESGGRHISAAELVVAAKVLGVELEYFTDPFRLAGEGRFSWRQRDGEAEELLVFEECAEKWIATYRHLSRLKGDLYTPFMPRLGLTSESSYAEATRIGEKVARSLPLGEVPSLCLKDVIEEKLQTLVLYVDATPKVSGAACQLQELNAILINRNESTFRRNYDLAHEFFHILTWDALPPRHIESESPTERAEKKLEQLADNFAAALLMPSWVLAPHLDKRDGKDLHSWLNSVAMALGVSSMALRWRLVNMGALSKKESESIDDNRLRKNGLSETRAKDVPFKFGRRFLSVLGWGLEHGHVSVRKAALLLAISVDELAELFGQHRLAVPFEL